MRSPSRNNGIVRSCTAVRSRIPHSGTVAWKAEPKVISIRLEVSGQNAILCIIERDIAIFVLPRSVVTSFASPSIIAWVKRTVPAYGAELYYVLAVGRSLRVIRCELKHVSPPYQERNAPDADD